MSRERPQAIQRRNQQQIINRAIELMAQHGYDDAETRQQIIDRATELLAPQPNLVTLPCACCGLGIERCACDWSDL
jgi:hypothetical protein